MGMKQADEFRQDAVRIALTSGLMRMQVASDLGVGLSTLNKWITTHRVTDVVSTEVLSLAQENERLRREVRILKEEKDILKKANHALTSKLSYACGAAQCTAKLDRFNGIEYLLPYHRLRATVEEMTEDSSMSQSRRNLRLLREAIERLAKNVEVNTHARKICKN